MAKHIDPLDSVLTKEEGELVLQSLDDQGEANIDSLRRRFLSQTFVGLTLSFEPNRKFLIQLTSWFSENLGQKVILDLTVDQKIIAGAIVICNNHWRDYSLASKFDSYKG